MNWLIVAGLLVVTFATYARALSIDFVWYDDNDYVTQNARVQQGLTTENVAWAFRTLDVSNWHPVTWLSHMLDVNLWGLNPGGHHLTNIVLHCANSVLLFLLLWKMTAARWPSATVAALFALHPLHVESVAWVAERKDVLSTLFGLLAIWCYVTYVRGGAWWWYLALVISFALSLMSKPMLVTLPFVLLLIDYWPLRRWSADQRSNVGLVLEKLPLLLLTICSSVITVIAQSAGHAVIPLEAVGFSQRLANAVVAYGMYLVKTVWPFELAVLYPLPDRWPLVAVLLSAIALAALTLVSVLYARKKPWLLVGWLLFLGTLVPVIGLVQVGHQAMADRYTYVPLIGVFIMAAWLLTTGAARLEASARKVVVASIALVLIALAVRTWDQIGHWNDSVSLFTRAVNVTHRNYIAHNNLGFALADRGEMNRAIDHYQRAVQIKPTYGLAHDNLGAAYIDVKRFDDAVVHLTRATELLPRSSSAYSNLGAALFATERPEEAKSALRKALELDPRNAEAYVNLGRILAHQGRPSEAEMEYRRALHVRPELAPAHVNLGIALAIQNRLDEAITHFQKAIELRPDSPEARQYLQMAQQQQQQNAAPSPQ